MPKSFRIAAAAGFTMAWLCACSTVLAQNEIRNRIVELSQQVDHFLQQNETEAAEESSQLLLVTALNQAGEIFLRLQQLDTAEKAYLESSLFSPQPVDAFLGLGIVYLRTGQYEKGLEATRKGLEVDSANADLQHLKGKLYFMIDKFKEAAEALEKAHSAEPENRAVAYALALSLLKAKQEERADAIFRQLIEQSGDPARFHALVGQAYSASAENSHPSFSRYLERAAREYRESIRLNPGLPRVHYYLALSHLLQEGTAALAKSARELELELAIDANQFWPNLLAGYIQIRNGNLPEAIRYLERAVALEPANADGFLQLALALHKSGAHERAIEMAERAVDLSSSDLSQNPYRIANAHYLLGQALLKTNRREEAERELELAAEYKLRLFRDEPEPGKEEDLNLQDFSLFAPSATAILLEETPPDQVVQEKLRKSAEFYRKVAAAAYRDLGRIRTSRLEFFECAELLQKAVFWDPSLPDLHFNMGLAYFKAGLLREARQPLEEAVRRNPENSESQRLLFELTVALVENKFLEEALQAADFLTVYSAADSPSLYLLRAKVHFERFDYTRALQDFRSALLYDPSVAEAHLGAGLALIRQGKLEAALYELEKELQNNPNHLQALYHKAFILVSLRRFQEAVPILNAVIRREPRHADAHYQLGKIQLEEGNLLLAVANLEMAAALEPSAWHIFYQLSRAYTQAGRMSDAQRALHHYRELKKAEEAARAGNPPG